MKEKSLLLGVLFLACSILSACSENSGKSETPPGQTIKKEETTAQNLSIERQPLPEGIQWLSNNSDPVYASPDAKVGGVFHSALLSFPMTFRVVGPDSNSSFRGAILNNQLSLINIHPNTERILPELATHWAYDEDKKTMYFKLDKDARWSDGVPVTAKDYAYTLEFMRSEHIVAPWYNDYYTKEIEAVIIYDDHTIAVKSTKAVPDLHLKLGISPTPSHFFWYPG